MHFLPFTRWGAIAVLIQLVLSIYIGAKRSPASPKILKATAILAEMSFASQILIVGVYWALLHEFVMKEIAHLEDPWMEFLFIYAHVWPGAAIFSNVLMSDVSFIKSHNKYMIPVGIIYLIVNLLGTLIRGQPVYPFLSWKDYKSPIIGIALVFIGKFSYDISCWLISKLPKKKGDYAPA
jgi:hypothetical protein